MALNGCAECLRQPREVDRLTEELHRLKQRLQYQERRATEGFFGSATPAAKLPVKANMPPATEPKRKGARPGRRGMGRRAFDPSQAERVVDVTAEIGDRCPNGDVPWEEKGTAARAVLDSRPVKAERVLYWCRVGVDPPPPLGHEAEGEPSYSYAPISYPLPAGRALPSKSQGASGREMPASMAGLVAWR